ncbi:MAG: AmmeMemoRadiSam system radical SAM enzyme, partial [Deltaproteobacteria bacterium]
MKARYWQALGDGKVRCELCPHRCVANQGGRGICGVRENRGGELVALSYGMAIA